MEHRKRAETLRKVLEQIAYGPTDDQGRPVRLKRGWQGVLARRVLTQDDRANGMPITIVVGVPGDEDERPMTVEDRQAILRGYGT